VCSEHMVSDAESAPRVPAAAGRPRVVAVLGSPRRKGNCAALLRAALTELEKRGAEVETIQLSAYDIRYCAGHDDCAERELCPIKDDTAELLDRFYEADAVLLASPVYTDNVSGQTKVFLDRACHDYSRGRRLRARVVGLVTVADSTGLDDTLAAMARALAFIRRPDVPTFSVKGYATSIGDAEKNDALMESARQLGRQLAEALLPSH
jgi:multimeric flavodoxin WrbA